MSGDSSISTPWQTRVKQSKILGKQPWQPKIGGTMRKPPFYGKRLAILLKIGVCFAAICFFDILLHFRVRSAAVKINWTTESRLEIYSYRVPGTWWNDGRKPKTGIPMHFEPFIGTLHIALGRKASWPSLWPAPRRTYCWLKGFRHIYLCLLKLDLTYFRLRLYP